MSISVKSAPPFTRIWHWIAALFILGVIQLSAQEEPQFPEPLPPAEPNTAAPGGRGAPSARATRAAALREKEIELLMVDQDLNAVLIQLEKLTGRPIIRSQSLPAVKINFDGLGPMSYDEAILAIESLLALNGVIITDLGDNFLKAVPAAGATGANAQVPLFLNEPALSLPPSQVYYTKFFKFLYLDAEKEGAVVVQSLGSGGNPPVVFPKNNALLVTDMLVNLQRMEEVLKTADKADYDSEHIYFFTLKHIKSSDLAQRLTKLTTGNSGIARYFNNNTTFEADERTNQLIVITHPSNKTILDNLIEELDKDVEPITSSEVFYIKHAQATEIDSLLEEVITGQQNARSKSESAKKTSSPESNTAPGAGGRDALAADAAPMPSPTEGIVNSVVDLGRNLQFSDFVTIVADERSNAIVAYGTKTDLIQIKRLIDQIDVLLAQVFIEVLIAEVTLTDEAVSGFSEFGISGNELEVTDIGTFPGTDIPLPAVTQYGIQATGKAQAGSSLITDSPFEFSLSLRPDEFSVILRTASENQNVRILSVPNIVTTHNQEANVNVSQSRPIITSSVSNLNNNIDGTTSNDVQYRDIGIQLKVKPLIGSNGIIQMEIEQIVENVISNTEINGTQQPIIGKREATSFVSVANGDIIVLAGLQETSFSTGAGKLWLLGDIPILGDFLNPSSELNERRELMIFIRPTVYFGPEDATKHAKEIIDKLDNGNDIKSFMEHQDMTEVTRDHREKALEESKEFEDETGWEHPFDVNAPNKSTNRSPYRGN
ncbi:secretin N-terminal domain-containing protein [Cerasicoccus arenae]|uniref:Type II secretion system protein GspD n=1 Tax=Cerasicoccus arenae TaxID=424488 RepID=A0A8J3DIR9_9BACT|nr:secretin N-terminal domain-containing protein [Cerasicoccus arenae]MBK1857964.1 hypothetical protein [Cerasicoccus arenae]GHB97784.1 type II secretion system protein GspD [Cerasicoccus arenae]